MPEDRKKLYMWLSVGSITAVIALIWFASIKYSISASVADAAESKKRGLESFRNLESDLKKQWDSMKNIFEVKETTSTASST